MPSYCHRVGLSIVNVDWSLSTPTALPRPKEETIKKGGRDGGSGQAPKDGAHTSGVFFFGIHKTFLYFPSLGLLCLIVLHCPSRMDSASAQTPPPDGPDVKKLESLDSDQEMSSIDAGSYTSSNRDSDFIPWEEVEEIQILHEATLQELLKARNDAVWTLLQERNALLHERCVFILSLLYQMISSSLYSKIPARRSQNRLF